MALNCFVFLRIQFFFCVAMDNAHCNFNKLEEAIELTFTGSRNIIKR